jgi:hypothetical protein
MTTITITAYLFLSSILMRKSFNKVNVSFCNGSRSNKQKTEIRGKEVKEKGQ